MNNLPVVTVYIPFYNAERYLANAIESVLSQDYQHLQVLLIDDGSTDRSFIIAQEYAARDRRFSAYSQKNQGLNRTNNVALRLSKGKYITRLDPDDTFLPFAISKMVNALEANPGYGMVFPDYFIVDEQQRQVKRIFTKSFNLSMPNDKDPLGACSLFKTDILKLVGGYSEGFRCQDGFDIWLKFIKNHKALNLNEPLFNYTRHGSNLTNNVEQIYSTRFKILEKANQESIKNRENALAVIPVLKHPLHDAAEPFAELAGKPLVQYTFDAVNNSKRIGDVIVSTDSEAVIDLAKSYGYTVFERPDILKDTFQPVSEVVKFTLDQLKLERASQFFCTLFINSPLRDSRVIDAAINMAEVYSSDSVICVDEITSNLFKESASGLQMLSNSQDFNKYEDDSFFVDNSAIYVTRASFFEDTRKLTAGRIAKLVIPKWSSFKIETHRDLQLAELIINSEKD